ncbi:hypothetical protein [Ralstonia sp. SET104]|uniref:hypothetical protein n=1 Tax=Ralstonia sp. SET104 TaxID=2448774 RepID=UPI000FF9EE5A|nr:hypothetical protein [Ralstonia sp. SET104]GCB06329.1 hypothetical protein PSUB009319_39600 [Ralstonia sp. SET104]
MVASASLHLSITTLPGVAATAFLALAGGLTADWAADGAAGGASVVLANIVLALIDATTGADSLQPSKANPITNMVNG